MAPQSSSSRKTAVAMALTTLLAGATMARSETQAVRWRTDVDFIGTLFLPDEGGPHPLVIFVPGSGCLLRMDRVPREHARQMSARGVAMFVYDKRGCGQSSGDWREVGLDELADDLLSAIPQLAAHPAIDANRIGLFGLSQGGWIALIAATKSDRIAFVAMLSGAPMTPAAQGHAVVELRMRATGWEQRSIDQALDLDRVITQVYRSDAGWEEAAAEVERASSEPWFEDSGVGLQPREMWNWKWIRTFMDYDPLPSLRTLEIPILAVFGENDHLVPPLRSQRIFDDLAPEALGPRESVLFAGVGHELRPSRREPWSEEYWSTLLSWIERHSPTSTVGGEALR